MKKLVPTHQNAITHRLATADGDITSHRGEGWSHAMGDTPARCCQKCSHDVGRFGPSQRPPPARAEAP